MRLHCPKCADPIPAQDVNIRSLVAKCERCDNVFSFQHETVTSIQTKDTTIYKRPENINQEETTDTLTLWWKWNSPAAITVLIASPAAFALAVWSEFQPHEYFQSVNPNWVQIFIWFIVCLYGTYWAIAHFVNRTVVRVDHENIHVSFQPLPWVGVRTNLVSPYVQLYTGRYVTGGRYPKNYISVNILRQSGKHLRAIDKLESIEHALYLEQEIEAFLGIADQPVRGELSRGL